MTAARQGDQSAIDELCARYQQRLTAVAGNAGAEDPEPVVERALAQAMLAMGVDETSDTVTFEKDVFARVLAAVVPVEAIKAAHGDREDRVQLDEPDPADEDGWRPANGDDPGPDERRLVHLLPPTTEPETDRWVAIDADAPALARRKRSWKALVLPLVGMVVVIGLSVGGALRVLDTDSRTSVDEPPSVGALIDGVRSAGMTSTDEEPEADAPTVTTVAVDEDGGPTTSDRPTTSAEVDTDDDGPVVESTAPATTAPVVTSVPNPPTIGAAATTSAESPAAAPADEFAGRAVSGADLSGQDLRTSDFRESELTDVDLSGSDLRGVSFAGATMVAVDLTGADLTDANLTDTKLDGVEMRSANVSGVDFTGATVSGFINGFWFADNPPINLP